MVNSFSKEERVAFEQMLEGFTDGLIMSRNVNTYGTNGQLMERTNDTIWRPQPYIGLLQDRVVGTPVVARNRVQLAVPSRLGFRKNDTFELDAEEMRDALQEGRLAESSAFKLASAINSAVLDVATQQATLVVTRTTAAGSYDDVALCDTIMNEQGVQQDQRYLALNTRDYNGMAGNLAGRQNLIAGKTLTAYERSQVGMVASFDTYKLDVGRRIVAASGGGSITVDTRTSAAQYWVPKATSTASTGEVGNVDNRYQTITLSSNTNVRAGDCFTVGGIEAVHQITKEGTGQPKTYRVISVGASNTVIISPPIISAQGGTDQENEYKNCIVTPAASAPVTFLNVDATGYNVFWRKPAIELLPGRYAVPGDQGVAVMRASTDQGIEVVMSKRFDNSTFKTFYTVDVLFGVVMTAPEMAGVLLFNQVP